MNDCSSCVMYHHDCILLRSLQEYIPNCPCLKCIVKVQCTFDETCERYSTYYDKLYADKSVEERIINYDLKYNPMC